MAYLCILFSAPGKPKNCEFNKCKFHNKLPNGFECPIYELSSDAGFLRTKITTLTKELDKYTGKNKK